jgi:hypothetical protein
MNLANHDFAPEPASRTRPREIFGLFTPAAQNIQEGTQLRTAAGWDGHVFLGVLKHSSTPAPLFLEIKGIRTRQEGRLVICR